MPLTDSITFTFTGAVQPFVVPDGVTTLNVVAIGGRGGDGDGPGGSGGFGALAVAQLAVNPDSSSWWAATARPARRTPGPPRAVSTVAEPAAPVVAEPAPEAVTAAAAAVGRPMCGGCFRTARYSGL
jgi:hypothetical protein